MVLPDAPREPEKPFILESDVRLSQSRLWEIQRRFYADRGIEAWTVGNVPQSVTTSPSIARAYARIVLGFLRDVQREYDLESSEPLYIVELGAGSGRFCYRFLKALAPMLERAGLAHKRVMYVMTDASSTVIDFWQSNPRLRELVDRAQLDFAKFDLLAPSPLHLLNQDTTLQAGTVANPLVLIANYVFDSVPSDCLSIKHGELFMNNVTVRSSIPELNLSAVSDVIALEISFNSEPEPIDEVYADPVLNDILRQYRERLGETTLLFPIVATQCLRYFQELSANRTLCLIGDLGQTREDELQSDRAPSFGAEGGFWLPVNFHALGEFARRLGGGARHPPDGYRSLNVSLLTLGMSLERVPEADLAYLDTVDHASPDDMFTLSRGLAELLPNLSLEQVLCFLRLSGWDSDAFEYCAPVLAGALPAASWTIRQAIVRGIRLAWEEYYPIGDTSDLAFACGVVLFSMDHYMEALTFFQRSLERFGDDPRTTFNMAFTLYRLGRLDESMEWLNRTLAADPTNEPARSMRLAVEVELGQRV